MSTQTNLEIILDQFENGERRYGEDPNFKSAVDSLKMGLGVYAVLDHYIKENTRLRESNGKSQSLIKGLTQTIVDQNKDYSAEVIRAEKAERQAKARRFRCDTLLGMLGEKDKIVKEKNEYIQKLTEDGKKLDRRIDELVNECAILNDFIGNLTEPKKDQ